MKKSGAVHVVRIRKVHKGKTYTSSLLRRSIREGKTVRSETLANLSSLPEETITLIEHSLKGVPVGRLDEGLSVVRSLPHGHVAAVLGTLRSTGLTELLGSRRTRERDLLEALIVERVLLPASKLGTARDLQAPTAKTSLGEILQVSETDENELYGVLDRLLTRKDRIETSLAQKHLENGTLVLYDVSSSYDTGTHCDLADYGHNRDGKDRFPQIVYGLLCAPEGCPVAISVFEGNTADPKTLESQIHKLRERFGLTRVVMVTDRGILTQAQLDKVKDIEGFDWITALRSPAIAKLRDQGVIQASLFDQKNLAEISSPDTPDERLVVCRNPVLALRRERKREDLLRATEEFLDKIVAATTRTKRPLKGQDKIGLRVGKGINKYHVGKHFILAIADTSFSYRRNEEKIRGEAALDGLYVIRTSVPRADMSSEKTVASYKSLAHVERAFRSLKTVDLEIRPIYHRVSDRVRAHVFLCMLAYYVEWHMKQKLAPLLYAEEDREEAGAARADIVSPAVPSEATAKKAQTGQSTEEGLPVQRFRGLLADLGTLCRNVMRAGGEKGQEFVMLTQATPLQQKVFSLLGVGPNTRV